MTNKWSIEIQNKNIDRFIKDHSLDIHDIRTQPFLGRDIYWEHTDEGWVISIYPRMYYEGPVEESIIHALSIIFRQRSHWFLETSADEFNQLTREFLSQQPMLSDEEREYYSRIIVSFDTALCSVLDLYYLLINDYINIQEARSLLLYRSENFISHRGALEFLATMAIFKDVGGYVSPFYDKIIKNKWYEMLPVLDRIEECVRSKHVFHEDSIFIFNSLLPNFKGQGFLEKIAVLRRNVLGPRDDAEIDYDVAISYAGEDRNVAEPIALALEKEQISIFYDKAQMSEVWGKDLYTYLTDVYSRRAKCCVIIVSQHYARKLWTTVEREAAISWALEKNLDYILPVRLDETTIPGLPPSRAYIDIQNYSIDDIVKLIIKRTRLLG